MLMFTFLYVMSLGGIFIASFNSSSNAQYSLGIVLRFQAVQWASYQIRKIACCACTVDTGNVFPATDFKGNRKLTRGGGENVPRRMRNPQFYVSQCCPTSKFLVRPTDHPRWIAGWSLLLLGGPYTWCNQIWNWNNNIVMCCRVWSWSPVPCEKYGPRDSVDKNRGQRPRFLS